MISKLAKRPKIFFLIDGVGAVLSAFMLGVVLVTFESTFGIPKFILYYLASLPILFALFDSYAFRSNQRSTVTLLRTIAVLNLMYCLLSLVLAVIHRDSISGYGWSYLIIEITMILLLVCLEFKIANTLVKKA